jgi:hypothetical protein
LDYPSIESLCRSSQINYQICKEQNYIWINKLKSKFPVVYSYYQNDIVNKQEAFKFWLIAEKRYNDILNHYGKTSRKSKIPDNEIMDDLAEKLYNYDDTLMFLVMNVKKGVVIHNFPDFLIKGDNELLRFIFEYYHIDRFAILENFYKEEDEFHDEDFENDEERIDHIMDEYDQEFIILLSYIQKLSTFELFISYIKVKLSDFSIPIDEISYMDIYLKSIPVLAYYGLTQRYRIFNKVIQMFPNLMEDSTD